ncbi:hypothetical protein KIL84_013858 [Mauremys mutica]|uniref:Uncharacterized protein n=1 Tax=Mauremys mutica TaxID=74926 RepID=A0A9D3WXP9_9SAUR|nr:hypothetical protein KIL84_013858 [Mauremys mutica]
MCLNITLFLNYPEYNATKLFSAVKNAGFLLATVRSFFGCLVKVSARAQGAVDADSNATHIHSHYEAPPKSPLDCREIHQFLILSAAWETLQNYQRHSSV